MPQAQSADGVIHDFPDGTSMDVINRVMKDYAAGTAKVANTQTPRDTSPAQGPRDLFASTPSAYRRKMAPQESGNPLGNLVSGGVGAVGGIVTGVLDRIAPELGQKSSEIVNTTQKALEGPGGEQPAVKFLGGAGATAAGGAALGAGKLLESESMAGMLGKYLGGDVVTSAVSPQSGATRAERDQGRAEDAVMGLLPVPLLAGARVIGGELIKKANSKVLSQMLEAITKEAEGSEPHGTAVAERVPPVTAQVQKQYIAKAANVRTQVQGAGGVDAKPILRQVDALGTPPKGGSSSPLIKRIQSSMEPYRDVEPELPKGVNKDTMSAAVIASLEKQGIKVRTTPGAKGDLHHLEATSDEIQRHVDSLSPEEQKAPEVEKLLDLKKTIDFQTKKFLKNNPDVAAMHSLVEGRYKSATEALRDPVVVAMGSNDPLVRKNAILGLVQSGDAKHMEKVATTLGTIGSENRRAAYNIVLFDAAMKAIDKKSGKINAAAFSQYFRRPEVAQTIKPLESAEGEQLRKGIENLIDWQHVGSGSENHHFIAHAADRAAFFGVLLGAEHAMRALGHADLAGAGESFVTAAGAAFITHKIGHFLDGALSTRFGRNFLIATSKVKPESSDMARLVDGFSRRLAIAAPVPSQALGASQPQRPPSP